MIRVADIQKRIIECLKNSTITKSELSRKLNISTSAISQIANGKILPSLETLANICTILDVKSDYLLCITENY